MKITPVQVRQHKTTRVSFISSSVESISKNLVICTQSEVLTKIKISWSYVEPKARKKKFLPFSTTNFLHIVELVISPGMPANVCIEIGKRNNMFTLFVKNLKENQLYKFLQFLHLWQLRTKIVGFFHQNENSPFILIL